MDVIEELKFLGKFTKKILGGGGGGVRVDVIEEFKFLENVNEELKFLSGGGGGGGIRRGQVGGRVGGGGLGGVRWVVGLVGGGVRVDVNEELKFL